MDRARCAATPAEQRHPETPRYTSPKSARLAVEYSVHLLPTPTSELGSTVLANGRAPRAPHYERAAAHSTRPVAPVPARRCGHRATKEAAAPDRGLCRSANSMLPPTRRATCATGLGRAARRGLLAVRDKCGLDFRPPAHPALLGRFRVSSADARSLLATYRRSISRRRGRSEPAPAETSCRSMG